MKYSALLLTKCMNKSIFFRFFLVLLMTFSSLLADVLTISNLDTNLAEERYHFQGSQNVLLHEFRISTSNAVDVGVSVVVFSYDDITSESETVDVNYSLINASDGNVILVDQANTSSSLSLSANDAIDLKLELDLSFSDDLMGKNLAGKKLYAQITFQVGDSSIVVNGTASSAKKVIVDGITNVTVNQLRGSIIANTNLLFPSEYAFMSEIRFSLDIMPRTDLHNIYIKEIRLNKIDDLENGFENVIEEIILIRKDQLIDRMGGSIPSDLTRPNNEINITLPPSQIDTNVLVFDVDSDINQVIINNQDFENKFLIETGENKNVFYMIYKIKDSVVVPTVNLMADVTDIFLKVEYETDVFNDVLLDESENSFLSSSYPDNLSRMDETFSLVALEANNFLLPSLGIIDNNNTGVNYGANNKNIPVLGFTLKSFNSEVLLSTINIRTTRAADQVTTGIPFEFDQENTFLNEVTQVSLYVDKGTIGVFDDQDEFIISNNAIDIIAQSDEGGDDVFEVQFNLSPSDFENNLSLITLDKENLETDGDKSFIITYDLDAVVNPGSQLQAFIANIETILIANSFADQFLSNWIPESNPILLGGDLPVPLLEDALSIPIEVSSIQLVDIQAISQSSVYPGQRNVDVMNIILKNDGQTLSNLNALFFSASDVFSSSVGFKKLYLYDGDDLISEAQAPAFPDQSIQIPNISLGPTATGVGHQQNHTLTLKADIGSKIEGESNLAVFFNGIQSEEAGFNFVGAVPSPIEPVVVNVLDFSSNGITVTASVTDADKINESNLNSSDVLLDVYISNTSDYAINILNVIPKVYFDRIDGLDISGLFEFSINNEQSFPILLNQGSSYHRQYEVKYVDKLQEGSANLDIDLDFEVIDQVGSLTLPRVFYQRYIDISEQWQQNATFFEGDIANNLNSILFLTKLDTKDEWAYPLHILDVIYSVNRLDAFDYLNHADKSFVSGTAVNISSYFYVYFRENIDLDFASLELLYQGQAMTRLVSASGQDFGYFIRREGDIYRIEILNVPDTLGQEESIVLSLQDGVGNQLEDLNIRFISSSQAALDRPLFYPNPYKLGQPDGDLLKLGLNLTKRSSIELYIFNHNGRLIETVKIPAELTLIGYNLFETELSSLENKLKPGLYVGKIIATDSDGNKDTKVVRLAVY